RNSSCMGSPFRKAVSMPGRAPGCSRAGFRPRPSTPAPKPVHCPPMQTLTELAASFAERGEAPAIHVFTSNGGEIVSYAALHERVRRTAAALSARGIAPGDRVLLCAPNGPDWVAAYFAIVSIGAIAVPVDDQVGREQLVGIVRHAAPRYAFTTRKHVDELAAGPSALDAYHLIGAGSATSLDALELPDSSVAASLDERTAGVRPEQTASLLYTSGTTGTPKAVPLTHRNLVSDARALIEARLIGPRDRVLMPLPLHHTYPFTVGMLLVLGLGARMVIP